ncbi:hypothetical protein HMPREF3203_01112 [Proteus mirabilis]|nr:hypothetical protein HMPREF3203_01112 [Proteus mirabilis]
MGHIYFLLPHSNVNKMLKMRSCWHFYHRIFKSICLFIHLLLLIVQQSNIYCSTI